LYKTVKCTRAASLAASQPASDSRREAHESRRSVSRGREPVDDADGVRASHDGCSYWHADEAPTPNAFCAL
jgi:hypothetical protein